jgi:hypothetical protein
MITPNAGQPVSLQCSLLGITRSSFYYQPSRNCPNDRDHLHTGPLGTLRRTPLHPRHDSRWRRHPALGTSWR